MSNLKLLNVLIDASIILFIITGFVVCWGVKHKKIKSAIAYQIANKIDEIFSKIVLMVFAICIVLLTLAWAVVVLKIKWLAWIVPTCIYLRHIILPGIFTKITVEEFAGMLLWSILALFWISSSCVKWWLRKHGYAESNNNQERKD